jgi:hypothetical protein
MHASGIMVYTLRGVPRRIKRATSRVLRNVT